MGRTINLNAEREGGFMLQFYIYRSDIVGAIPWIAWIEKSYGICRDDVIATSFNQSPYFTSIVWLLPHHPLS